MHVPVVVSHVVVPEHVVQERVPPQPSAPPHAFGARSAQVSGLQQLPWLHVQPGSQSPPCIDEPSHEEASPQKSPSQLAGGQGTQAPKAHIDAPAHVPQNTVSPHAFESGPQTVPLEAHS